MQSGKSTAALLTKQYLTHKTGEPWVIVAFADALKRMVANICNVPVDFCYTNVGKAMVPDKNPRGITMDDLPVILDFHSINIINEVIASSRNQTIGKWLQIVGQAFRDVDYYYWIGALESTLHDNVNYIIEDVRFPNECEWIKTVQNGLVARIHSSSTASASASDGRIQNHNSETALDNYNEWDFVIENARPFSEYGLLSDIIEKLQTFM